MIPLQEKLRVLLVDDQLTQIAYERQILGNDCFEFSVARNGAEALETAATERPDIILLDLAMPGMDGLEVIRRLRADAVTSSIPVIMVTTSDIADSMERAYLEGCSDYIIKPVRREEILAKIGSLTGIEAL